MVKPFQEANIHTGTEKYLGVLKPFQGANIHTGTKEIWCIDTEVKTEKKILDLHNLTFFLFWNFLNHVFKKIYIL